MTTEPARSGLRRSAKIAMAVLLVPVALFAVLSGVAAVFVGLAQESVPSEPERALVLNASELFAEAEPRYAAFRKLTYIDGAYDIEYEYDDPREGAPYISCTVKIEVSVADAKTAYIGQWAGILIGFEASEAIVEERNDLYAWGDASRLGVIRSGGEPTGNLFVARSGRKVFFVLFTGMFFNDIGGAEEILGDVMSRLEAYSAG